MDNAPKIINGENGVDAPAIKAWFESHYSLKHWIIEVNFAGNCWTQYSLPIASDAAVAFAFFNLRVQPNKRVRMRNTFSGETWEVKEPVFNKTKNENNLDEAF